MDTAGYRPPKGQPEATTRPESLSNEPSSIGTTVTNYNEQQRTQKCVLEMFYVCIKQQLKLPDKAPIGISVVVKLNN